MPTARRPMRRSSSPTRFATASTWQPATRVEQILIRRRLPFSGDVHDLIACAAHLVAPLSPGRAVLSFYPRAQHLFLLFGADEHGVETHVSVTLRPSDVGLLMSFARDRSVRGTLFVDFPDGDGEELCVPRVSVEELAQMPVPALSLRCDASAKGGA